ncbi:MAG: hypothetical protein J6Q57_06990 [Paraprevotella sp.]|nr:hypothetical protein [Paraprevotella sp.]
MKKIYTIAMSLMVSASIMMAQTPYINENFMASDLNGTARFIGMGGALGALGADISAGSANPAAQGLYRRSDVGMTLSVLTQQEKPDLNADMTHVSFDQFGFVLTLPMFGKNINYINFGINYQKRANFNHAFIADNDHLNGLSQTQQMADILNYTQYSTPLADLMYDACLVNPIYERDQNGNVIMDENNKPRYDSYDAFLAEKNQYDRITEGGIDGYDFNISMNFRDRLYFGFMFGFCDVDYYSYSTYREYFQSGRGIDELYSLYNTHSVKGVGFNAKFGIIARPIETSAFRVGLSVETPTIYHLDSYTDYSIDSPMSEDENYELIYGSFYTHRPEKDLFPLMMRLKTPWKVRASLGHTIGKYLALGAEYEFANYGGARQTYEDLDYGYTNKDSHMDAMYKNILCASHSFKFGMEFNIIDQVALRAGYNYFSKAFNKDARLDQTGESPAFNYQSSTDFINKGDVNIFTAGIGFRGKHLYADFAYKYRMQSGDFYSFDDTYIGDDTHRLQPVNVNMNNHQVYFSLGYKF